MKFTPEEWARRFLANELPEQSEDWQRLCRLHTALETLSYALTNLGWHLEDADPLVSTLETLEAEVERRAQATWRAIAENER